MPPLYLISCVAAKTSTPSPARALYTSPWFRKARAWVEGQGAEYRILSAEHGLVDPDAVVAPYERTLNKMRVADRRAWAERVLGQLDALDLRGRQVIFLAGKRYREFLSPALQGQGVVVSVPMVGLGIGKQLAWLNGRLA